MLVFKISMELEDFLHLELTLDSKDIYILMFVVIHDIPPYDVLLLICIMIGTVCQLTRLFSLFLMLFCFTTIEKEKEKKNLFE